MQPLHWETGACVFSHCARRPVPKKGWPAINPSLHILRLASLVCRDWKVVVRHDNVWRPLLPGAVAAALSNLGAWETYVLGQQTMTEHNLKRCPYLLGLFQCVDDEPDLGSDELACWPEDTHARKGHWLEALQLHAKERAPMDYCEVARFILNAAASSGAKDLPSVNFLRKRLLRLHTAVKPFYTDCRKRGNEFSRTQLWTFLDEKMPLHGEKSQFTATVVKAVASGELVA